MKNKKAQGFVDSKVLGVIIVIVVITLVLLFLFRADINKYLRNLPGYSSTEGKESDVGEGELAGVKCTKIGELGSGNKNVYMINLYLIGGNLGPISVNAIYAETTKGFLLKLSQGEKNDIGFIQDNKFSLFSHFIYTSADQKIAPLNNIVGSLVSQETWNSLNGAQLSKINNEILVCK